jgi:hypothetical protein
MQYALVDADDLSSLIREWHFICAWLDEQSALLDADLKAENRQAFAQRVLDIRYYTRKLRDVEAKIQAALDQPSSSGEF